MAELTSLEIKFWFEENKENIIGRLEKIWQVEESVIFRIYIKGKGTRELVIVPGGIFFTQYQIEKPPSPSNFVMQLRKHLKGKWIKKAYQYHGDRIIVLEFDEYFLIMEIMKLTNIILTDKQYKIIAILQEVESKQRTLKMHKSYEFPPHKKNIDEVELEEFVKDVKEQGLDNIPKIYNIAPKYWKYVLKKGRSPEDMYKVFKEIYTVKKPCRCDDEIYGYCVHEGCTYNENLNALIESVFIHYFVNKKGEKENEKKPGKVEYMMRGLENLIKKKEDLEKKVEKLSLNYPLIEEILSNEDHPLVLSKDYRNNILEVNIDGEIIKLWSNLTPYQNISWYYEEIKKIKKKIENLKMEIEKEKKRKQNNAEAPKVIKIEKKKQKKWYENFKWFYTSKGKLFVLGKDATTNEILIKKYMESKDLVFHSFLPGSGFGLLKGGRDNADEEEILECAQFVASHSSLWKQKIFSGEVFWVYPEQVSKKAPSGEYIHKGSFMIYGKKNILKVPLELGFGYDDKNKDILYGPFVKIMKMTKHYVVVIPGDKNAKELVDKIKKRLIKNLKKEDAEFVMRYDNEFFRERIPFGIGDVRGKV